MKYDSKMKAMAEEVSTLTQHMTKYRRERDTYKEMLDGTQRTIAELKGSGNYKASRADNATEVRIMGGGLTWGTQQPYGDMAAIGKLLSEQMYQSRVQEKNFPDAMTNGIHQSLYRRNRGIFRVELGKTDAFPLGFLISK